MKSSNRMERLASAALILAVLTTIPGIAHAQNLLVNGSFEDGNFTGVNEDNASDATQLSPGATNITGWQIGVQELAWFGTGNPYGIVAPDGNRSLDMTGYNDGDPYATLTQSIATQPGATYNVSVFLGVLGGNSTSIEITAGGTTRLLTFTGSNPGNQWGSFGFDFIAPTALTSIVLNPISTTQFDYIGLDNASVTFVSGASLAPEPASLPLITMTLLPLSVGYLRRRRTKATPKTNNTAI